MQRTRSKGNNRWPTIRSQCCSASRQAQTNITCIWSRWFSGSGVGAVIGLSAAAGECGAGGPGGAGVASQVHPIVDGQREEYK
ncbi:hypothetical protein Tco_0231077 [Tanacetum coccineum]|uniref:Uncharacterized protein n=1 Tax=Tanacetum coccineum TaxID=301880 RepID=A0ABQ5CZT8_9ASTR